MTQTTFSLLTNKGRSKEAAALANNSRLEITHIAIGDGKTVPSGGETKLYNEVDRKQISGNGLVVGTTDTAYFEIYLNAADGPYTISEAGLIDADGDLIAITHYNPPISKPTPDSGQTVEGTVRIEVAFSNIENIVVKIDNTTKIPTQRLTLCPWIPVKSTTTKTPPDNPKVGDCYLIPDGATGLWKNQGQKIAEFNLAGWTITEAQEGHGVSLPDGRIFQKINGKYQPQLARDVQSGQWNHGVAYGTGDMINVTLSPPPLGYFDGMVIVVTPVATSTTKFPNINVNNLGNRPIINPDGSEIKPNAIREKAKVVLVYDDMKKAFVIVTSTRQSGQVIGFSASGSDGENIPSATNYLMKNYKVVNFDTENSFDNATGSYRCPVKGYFTITGYFWFVDCDCITKIYLQKNDQLVCEQSTNSRGRVLSVTTTVDVDVGDRLRMLLVQESNSIMSTYVQDRATCGFTGIFAGA